MNLAYEIRIGLRYIKAKRKNSFISFISFISMFGIALGVWVLITVVSVMNGFEQEFRERILGMASHATISSFDHGLKNWQQVVAIAQRQEQVVAAAPYVEGQLMISKNNRVSGVIARGIVPQLETKVASIEDKIKYGSLDALTAGSWKIVIGNELARSIGATVGDNVTVITPQSNITIAGFMPRLKTFTVAGVFELGMQEYDSAFVVLNATDAAKLFKLPPDSVTGVRLKLVDMFRASTVAKQIAAKLDDIYWVRDWTQQHANLFSAIKTERLVMSIILGLIIIVAAFNIISTLIMVVTEKQSDIAILRTLGASPNSIMLIFLVQGVVIGFIGTLIGVICGVISGLYIDDFAAWLERVFDFHFISADVYYISAIPSKLRLSSVIWSASLALVVSFLITLYPAYRASQVNPAQALRYE